MKLPWVNVLVLILLLVQAITGYFGFTNGRQSAAWILQLHGIVAYGVVLLMFLKASIIIDAWRRRRRWTRQRIGFLVALILLVLTLASGLLWTFQGPIYLGAFSLVSLHIYIAVPLMLLMLWHSWHMRYVRRVPGAAGRRLFLGGLATVMGGLLLWGVSGRVRTVAGLSGAARRFTGSYETGSLTPNYPVVSWIADRPPPVDVAAWRLRVEGLVAQSLSLTYEELAGMASTELLAALDCTGGWYSVQRWRGISVGALLVAAGALPGAGSVTFEAVSGYRRRFPMAEAAGALLALESWVEVDGLYRTLSHGHGAPARLVLPGRRGMEWVKWLAVIRVNQTGALWQSPLPLQ